MNHLKKLKFVCVVKRIDFDRINFG